MIKTRKIVTKALALLLVVSAMLSMAVMPAFAARFTASATPRVNSYCIADKQVTFDKANNRNNKITVMNLAGNNSKIIMKVYPNKKGSAQFSKEIQPGKEWTYTLPKAYGTQARVIVYVWASRSKQNVTIKTTNGTIR